jgi:hypothetical protein
MDDQRKSIKEQAADKLKGIKEGVSTTADKLKQMPGDASAAAADKLKNIKEGVSTTADMLKQMPGNATTAATDKLKDISSNVSAATSEKIHEWVDEFNRAVPSMKALGFSVKSFSIGVGLIPELNATLVGAVQALDSNKLEEMVQRSTNRALNVLLGGLQTAAKFKDQLTTIGVKGIEIDIKLGLPPTITVNLLT